MSSFCSYCVKRKEPATFCGIIATDFGAANVRFYMNIDYTLMYVFCVKIYIVLNT